MGFFYLKGMVEDLIDDLNDDFSFKKALSNENEIRINRFQFTFSFEVEMLIS